MEKNKRNFQEMKNKRLKIKGVLFCLLLFFFPVLVNGNKSNYKAEKNNSDYRNNSEICSGHRFPPLSKTVAKNASRNTAIPNIIMSVGDVFAGATIGLKTLIARINFAVSYKNFAKFSLCFFVNSIMSGILFGFLLFFFPVLPNNDCHENNSQNCNSRSHCIKSHQISPLSRVTPLIMQKVYAITPDIIFPVSKPVFVTNCPNTTIASIKFAALKNAFARFSLCFFVNSIYWILAEMVKPVNGKIWKNA